jgi:hypothetical protein
MVQCQVINGATIMLRKDIWLHHSLDLQLPHLFSFAKNENVLVMAISLALDENELADQLYLPLSEEAFTEFH